MSGSEDTAFLISAKNIGGTWGLTVLCPHCGRRHFHGGGSVADGPPTLGHRVAHCEVGKGRGYVIRGES